jgi:rhodanese-related sulfurtransferase
MPDYEISPVEADLLIRAKAAKIIDVREPWEFATARIEGSILIPMAEITSRASQELNPAERLIIVCHHGIRSMNVTVWLRRAGFGQAQSLRGGIDAWSATVDSKVGRY